MKEPIPQNPIEHETKFETALTDFRNAEKGMFETATGVARDLCLAFMLVSTGLGHAGSSKGIENRSRKSQTTQQVSK